MRNDLGKLMRGKGLQKPTLAYNFIRIHSLMVYTDIEEYTFVGDIKTPLLRCLPFIAKPKPVVILTTLQYTNCKTFSNLQFRQLLKNVFHTTHVDLRDTLIKFLLYQ